MKKLMAFLLTLALVATCTVSGFALNSTDTGTITVSGIELNADVKAYKIVNVNFADGTVKGYSWTTEVAAWMAGQTTWSSYTVKTMGAATESVQKAFYSALSDAISKGTLVLTPTQLTTTGTDPDSNEYSATVGMGQYLIIVTGVSQYIYQPCTINLIPELENGAWVLKASAKAHTKRTPIDIIKKITDSDAANPRDEDTVGVGDTVYFEITIDVPVNPADTTKALNYSDYMSAGLTYDTGSYRAYGMTGTTVATSPFDTADLTWAASTDHTGYNETTRSFAYSTIKSFDKIVIRYSAKLNSAAKVGTAEPNTARVTWDEFHKEDTVKVYTYGLKIVKIDGDTEANLPGAWFVVEKNTGTAAAPVWTDVGTGHGSTGTVDTAVETSILPAYNGHNYWVSDSEGKISVTGLDEGSYRFIEIKAPTDYNLLTTPVPFTITAAKDTSGLLTGTIVDDPIADTIGYYDSSVADYSKIVLPATGGAGTVLFTVIGSAIMLAAGLFLCMNRRKIFAK